MLNPFRGVVQVIEGEGVSATSRDGLIWQLYGDDGHGWVRPIGVWQAGTGQVRGIDLPPALRAALSDLPPLPFTAGDPAECWLLDAAGEPLALLASAPLAASGVEKTSVTPRWHPFVEGYAGFVSPALSAAGIGPEHHAGWLAEAVKRRAGASPETSWFERRCAWPLLAPGNNPLEQSAITDYHAHVAPLLLAWPGLTGAERAALERAAFTQPQACERAFRLWPQVLDEAGLESARVASCLLNSV